MSTEPDTKEGHRPDAKPEASSSLQHRVFLALAVACSVVTVAVVIISTVVYQMAVFDETRDELARECHSLASALNAADDDIDLLSRYDFEGTRVTYIAADGTVLYDSVADAAEMENHADRPEFKDAVAGGEGTAERDSATTGYRSFYHAILLNSGDVIRVGLERNGVVNLITQDLWVLVLLVAGIVAISWFVSLYFSRRLVRPILDIDLEGGNAEAPYVELEPLVSRLNDQYDSLVSRMEQIQDIDDMRREFTANVTHELKTPIASILGASELIRDGVARPEDVAGFAGRIYDDAKRLSSLVSDILTLSKLDDSEREGDNVLFGAMEVVDLYSVASDVVERYESRAGELGVKLRLEGTSTLVSGNPALLDELVGNLVSNAVRYNRRGGKVIVRALNEGGRPTLRVIDNGIGIPKEAQSKVFERFYRVDKGRSREKGGTGLGLAIVKHAAAYHGATVDLKSELGRGTTITVTFPAIDVKE